MDDWVILEGGVQVPKVAQGLAEDASAKEVFEEEALVEESLVEEALAEKAFAEEEEGPRGAQPKEAIAEGALRDQIPGEDVQVKVNSAEGALAEESLA